MGSGEGDQVMIRQRVVFDEVVFDEDGQESAQDSLSKGGD